MNIHLLMICMIPRRRRYLLPESRTQPRMLLQYRIEARPDAMRHEAATAQGTTTIGVRVMQMGFINKEISSFLPG